MCGIKNLRITNFRGIEHLDIDDFSRVNVFLGQNNSGKTTVLEAIAMLMGDGLRRYLSIVASAANPMVNIFLIDEIDNGLHYSVYKKLWKAVFAMAKLTDKQVFVTTHSKETILHLNEMLQETPEYKEDLRLYTIERTLKKGIQAYKYTHEGLRGACDNDVEIRGLV